MLGVPIAPLNLQSMVDKYHSHFSSILFTWNTPSDNSRIDYYQYQLVKEMDSFTYNTTNTSAVLPDIPYNKNVTFSITAVNCVGSSAPLRQTITIGRCHYTLSILIFTEPC